MGRPTFGFGMYFTYSRMVLDHEDLAKAYDFEYFNSRMNDFGVPGIYMPNNMPTAALPMLPIAWLNASLAKSIWTVLSVGMFFWSLKRLFLVFEIPTFQNLGLGLVAFAFLFRPAYDGIALGQMYFLILWLLVLSIPVKSSDKGPQVFLPLAIAFVIKGYGLVQLLWFAVRRNHRVLMMGMICGLLVVLFSLPLVGFNSWGRFLNLILSEAASAKGAHVSYQSINGFLHHFLTYDAVWSPSPLLTLPDWVVAIVSVAVNILLIAIVVKPSPALDSSHVPLSYAATIAAGVVTYPMASEYHYVMFLPLIFGLAKTIQQHRSPALVSRSFVAVVAISSVIMALPIKYQGLQPAEPIIGFLAYPRLYAGLCLILCYVFLMRRIKTQELRTE